jgi:3-dehydroquinate dehydratase II
MRILVINGPNLNLLGQREPELYGSVTLPDIETLLTARAEELGVELWCAQSNDEGEIVSLIQEHRDFDGLIINAGGYTHTSVAIADAIAATQLLTVEVHLSNIYKREEFRHHSYVAAVAWGQIAGLGYHGYLSALDSLHRRLSEDAAAPA